MSHLMMASVCVKKRKHLPARLATNNGTCGFCRREVDDEVLYGKLYVIGDIYCHYYCVLLSCCLIQKGKDEEGLFGFLYPDILAEIERSKKHKCSYCNQEGATLGCSVTQCRKQFHLPCGREKNAVSMFHGNYKSYCQQHAPKQKVPNNIMENIKERKRREKEKKLKINVSGDNQDVQEMVCVICYERVDAFPSLQTFWPPCCARDAWFHRSCLQRMALTAGIHYLKCPLCNDKENFYQALQDQGYYVPDRDAAWELEQNAFAEIYERTVTCDVTHCKCPHGRDYDIDNGPWDIKLCLLCGSVGAHPFCAELESHIYVCEICKPAAPSDPKYLEAINAMTLPDPNQNTPRRTHGPIMPSRMSLRRTKPRLRQRNAPSSSTVQETTQVTEQAPSNNTLQSRQELNLKTPKRRILQTDLDNIENKLLSPIKKLEEKLYKTLEEKQALDSFEVNCDEVIDVMRKRLLIPAPLVVRDRILNTIIEDIIENRLKEIKEPIKEWNSPKKHNKERNDDECTKSEENKIKVPDPPLKHDPDISNNYKSEFNSTESYILTKEFLDKNLPIVNPKSKPAIFENNSFMEISEKDQKLEVNIVNAEEKEKKVALKLSPCKDVLGKNIDIDLEIFKNHYLSEVGHDDKNKDLLPENIFDEQCNKTNPEAAEKKRRKKIKNKKQKEKRYEGKSKVTKNMRKRQNREDDHETEKTGIVLKFSSNIRKNKKLKKKGNVTDKTIHVNIKWKKEELKLKITKNCKRKRETFNQYVLEKSKDSIVMTPAEVKPPKRKYVKTEKTTDNLKQTSIATFFNRIP